VRIKAGIDTKNMLTFYGRIWYNKAGWLRVIYVCAKCKFIFERSGVAEHCEDCGSPNIRSANEDEIAEYKKNRNNPDG